jgi:hypothetical protein
MPITIEIDEKEGGLKPIIICDYNDCGEKIIDADHGTCEWSEPILKFYHADCYEKFKADFVRLPLMRGIVKSMGIHEFLLYLIDDFKLTS